MEQPLRDYASELNASPYGWCEALGFRYLRATADEVVGELEITARHLTADGMVDEALYCGMIEAAASAGAALHALPDRRLVVGLENQTSFLRRATSGRLRVTATPRLRDQETQVWEAEVTDAHDRVLASGRLRLLSVEADAPLADRVADIPPGQPN